MSYPGSDPGPQSSLPHLGQLLPDLQAFSFVAVLALAIAPGCNVSPEPPPGKDLVPRIGIYEPPPRGIARMRIGVPPLQVRGPAASKALEEVASDHLTALLFRSRRFDVMERTELEEILRGDRPEPGRRVDRIFLGKLTDLRVRGEAASPDPRSRILIECKVNLRMVDPVTGAADAEHSGEFLCTDTLSAREIEILGAIGDGDIRVSEKSQGMIVRLVLDDAVRRMLPRIDRVLMDMAREAPAATPPSTPPAPAKKFCPSCGQEIQTKVTSCPGCGGRLDG